MKNNIPKDSELPQYPESLWRQTTKFQSFPRLNENIKTDVAIIGAGISGITTAYLLVKEGFKVTLFNDGTICNGTTGYTTAKITAQHGLIYDKLITHFGEEQAKLYYQANQEAVEFIRQTVSELQIDCDFQEEDAYLYADTDESLNQLHTEWEAYEKLGLAGHWHESLPIPIVVKGAIQMPHQAQFHPLHYLQALLEYIISHGGTVYENTSISEDVTVKDDGIIVLNTEHDHQITCKHAVSASHFPFTDGGGLFFTRLHAERSYSVAIEPEIPFESGMYINCGYPTRSLRSAKYNGKDVILVGGETHKTGKGICTIQHYEQLEQFGGKLYGIRDIPYRWSTQDLVTLDNVPYIGQITKNHPNIYVTTGFGKWGMTTSTLSGLLIRDLIQGRDNRYAEVFTPSRFKANPSIKNFVVQNADVAAEWISGKLEIVHGRVNDLQNDQGMVIRHHGQRAGAYKDPKGTVFVVDTTCTHLGCEVEWNEGERSWDCPCHGSRFNYKGEVIEGPATENLERLEVTE